MKPKTKVKYTPDEIKNFIEDCTGWNTEEDGAPYGYTVADYFDDEGFYLGPDVDGIEPTWD